MPIISTSYLLATLATQAASALFNAKRGKKYSEELAKKQQEYEERVLTEGIENARAEFAEMCALQRELELEMQQDRLQMIRDSLKSNIMLEAYRHSLKDWPLLVPPFVIKNEYLPVLEFEEREQNHTIPVNCIMTTSSDTKFNLKIFTLLEEKLALFFSKHWRGDKAIRFYQQAWRNNVTDIGAMMHDIKAHLSEVPTIVLSPIIDGNKLKFAFSWWGMSNKIEDEHIAEPDNVFDPELSVEVAQGMDYDEKTIEKIVDETFNKLAAFISYFADLYYWNFYKMVPTLPNLLSSDLLDLPTGMCDDYINAYVNRVVAYLERGKFEERDPFLVKRTTEAILQRTLVPDAIYKIHKGVLNNKEFLLVSDIPLLRGLSEFKSVLSSELSKTITSLEKEESITICPFSNSDEMFYNAERIFKYSSYARQFHIKFIDKYSFIACITNEYGEVLYSSSKSRFYLFVTCTQMPLAQCGAGTLDLVGQKLQKSKEKKNPCEVLAYNIKEVEKQINIVRDFLKKIRIIFKQLTPIMSLPTDIEKVPQVIMFDDVKSWIKRNRTTENEFRLVLSYNERMRIYCLVGSFVDNNKIIDGKTYISYFSYLDDSIKNLFKYNYIYKLKIN